jgi:ABC-type iron transport system FetAB permease component
LLENEQQKTQLIVIHYALTCIFNSNNCQRSNELQLMMTISISAASVHTNLGYYYTDTGVCYIRLKN